MPRLSLIHIWYDAHPAGSDQTTPGADDPAVDDEGGQEDPVTAGDDRVEDLRRAGVRPVGIPEEELVEAGQQVQPPGLPRRGRDCALARVDGGESKRLPGPAEVLPGPPGEVAVGGRGVAADVAGRDGGHRLLPPQGALDGDIVEQGEGLLRTGLGDLTEQAILGEAADDLSLRHI